MTEPTQLLTEEQRFELWRAFAGGDTPQYFAGFQDQHWTAGVDRMAAVLAPMLDGEFEKARVEADRLRAENTAMAAKIAAVRALPAIEIGIHWNSQSEAEATGRNATLLEVRRILDGGDAPRDDLTQTEVRNRFQRHMMTVRALGVGDSGEAARTLDQSGEGQAND